MKPTMFRHGSSGPGTNTKRVEENEEPKPFNWLASLERVIDATLEFMSSERYTPYLLTTQYF